MSDDGRPPGPEEIALDAIEDPDTDAIAMVARGPNGGLFALDFGSPDLGYEDFVELAAYHLISLEDQSEKGPQETIRDVVQRRNELKERPKFGTGPGGPDE